MYKIVLTFILLGIIVYLLLRKKPKLENLTDQELSSMASQRLANQKYINEQIPNIIKDTKFEPLHYDAILTALTNSLKENDAKKLPVFIEAVKNYYDSKLAEQVYIYLRLANNDKEQERNMIYAGLLAKLLISNGKIGTLTLDQEAKDNLFLNIKDVINNNNIIINS